MRGVKGRGRERGSLKRFDIYTEEHTWLLQRLMLHSLNTSVCGAGGGPASEHRGVNSLLSPVPVRPILLPGDKCGIQAWWQACRGETDAMATARASRR